MNLQEWVKVESLRQNDVRRESFDKIPCTLLSLGIVFLSVVVPLYFHKEPDSCEVQWCFRISVIAMALSLICCGILFKRAIRVAESAMKVCESSVSALELPANFDARFLTRCECVLFWMACALFVGAIISLVVAMFVGEGVVR